MCVGADAAMIANASLVLRTQNWILWRFLASHNLLTGLNEGVCSFLLPQAAHCGCQMSLSQVCRQHVCRNAVCSVSLLSGPALPSPPLPSLSLPDKRHGMHKSNCPVK